MSNYFILLFIFNLIRSFPDCIVGENFCKSCNPVTKLCVKCEKEIYIPDEKGGCKITEKCKEGVNYCNECNYEKNKCEICDLSYYPDEIGGCSYTNNCQLSYKGECFKCKNNYILNGKNKICKSLNSEEYKHCKIVNETTLVCDECEEGYFLNEGDNKCINVDNCYKSKFGICSQCKNGYYLDKNDNLCKEEKDALEHCKISIDGKICDICDDHYYFDEEKKCIKVNYCLKRGEKYDTCEKCIEGYYLSESKDSCTKEENCLYGNPDIGICDYCKENYYIDYLDRKCKLNNANNEFKYCEKADGNCYTCIGNYNLGNDYKCVTTRNCEESENELCILCEDNFYLGYDHKCTTVEHCIYSFVYECIECEDNYYYNRVDSTCKLWDYNYTNCKYGYEDEFCVECKNGYYINQTDHICYDNKIEGDFYKCSFTLGNVCVRCSDNYYLGSLDNKCTSFKGCSISENVERCIICDEYYCLDKKTGKCEKNNEVFSEEKKIYYRCNMTNNEGNECEVCLDGFEIRNGLCYDDVHCTKKDENGKCLECQNNEEGYYCLNPDFGCVEIFFENCLECNDYLDFDLCHQCFDGYELDENNFCEEIN